MVSESDLEAALDFVRTRATGSVEGIFGPGSMTWRIDREAVIFLGAGRALLLQLAHPWVAAAVTEHSRTFADPIGRFHRTFDVVFAMVFGSLDKALAAARHLHHHHATIVGRLPEAVGPFDSRSSYRANEVAALRWVHATLVETAIIVHDLILPPFSVEERERYWAESRLFGALFGLTSADLPADWPAFAAYNDGYDSIGYFVRQHRGTRGGRTDLHRRTTMVAAAAMVPGPECPAAARSIAHGLWVRLRRT